MIELSPTPFESYFWGSTSGPYCRWAWALAHKTFPHNIMRGLLNFISKAYLLKAWEKCQPNDNPTLPSDFWIRRSPPSIIHPTAEIPRHETYAACVRRGLSWPSDRRNCRRHNGHNYWGPPHQCVAVLCLRHRAPPVFSVILNGDIL